MADLPQVGTVQAQNVVITERVDTIHAERLTVLAFPSGARVERVFASVPRQGPPLVGRDQTLADLRVRITHEGAMALHGLPGIGKTALALALVYDAITLGHFSGGVLWAGLGPAPQADSILGLWGTALGLDLSAEPETARRAQRLNAHMQERLAGKPFLIVLDDVWRWADAEPFLYFSTPGSALLMTTRDEELAQRFARVEPQRVQDLPEAEAIELLVCRYPEALQVDPDGVRELARKVGGLPLALVLLGAELAANAGQPRWIRATLGRLLAAPARLALRDRQLRPRLAQVSPTLQSIVDLSLEALPDEETRAAFAELGVFAPKPADFSREAVLAVWQVSVGKADDQLRTLYQRALLEVTSEDRFSLHQVLADVATSRLAEEAPVAASRHFMYYRRFVECNREAWQSIEPEFPQIRRAWAWVSRTQGQEIHILRLVGAIGLFMERRGLGTELLEWLNRAVQAARALGQREQEATLINNIGWIYRNRGDMVQALLFFEMALVLFKSVGDRAKEAITLTNIGLVHQSRGELARALPFFESALPGLQATGRRAMEAHTLTNIGLVHQSRGELDDALGLFERALVMFRAVGDRAGEANVLNNIGTIHSSRGDQAQALDFFEQALLLAQSVGTRAIEANSLNNVGMVRWHRGELDEALDSYKQALLMFRALDDRLGEANVLNNVASIQRSRGELAQALPFFEQALALFQAVGDRAKEATVLNNIGEIHHSRGELPQALLFFEQALAIAQAVGDRAKEATALGNIGSIQQSRGELAQALPFFEQALALFHAVGDRAGEGTALNNIGSIQQSRGELAQALPLFEQALALFQAVGDRTGEAYILNNIGTIHSSRGDQAQALDFFKPTSGGRPVG